jgi:hypothetical protein
MNYVAVGIITKSFGDIAWYLDQLFNTKIIESGPIEHANQQTISTSWTDLSSNQLIEYDEWVLFHFETRRDL